jgi:hypothetical protein
VADVSEDAIRLTREAFERFWFRYCEADKARLFLHAQTDVDAEKQLDTLMGEVAEYWPMLVQECER